MNTAEKALATIREYDRLMTVIAKNKSDIGDGLGACTRFADAGYGRQGIEGSSLVTHLAEAFTPHDISTDEDWLPVRAYSTPEEIAEILSECPGCQKAYAAIQERRANRKKLGAVKRAMRMIGRTRA